MSFPSHIAVIDIGTNTVLLLIAKVFPDRSYETLCEEIRFPRLGDGLSQTPFFSQDVQDRVNHVLEDYQKKIEKFSCEEVLVTGTAAFRKAKNAGSFAKMIQDRFGFSVKIISGEEEARFIHSAAMDSFSHLQKPVLVLDIGGGSTEFIFDTEKDIKEISLPMGVVTLTEQFFFSDPPTEQEFETLKAFIEKSFENLPKGISVKHLVATAGTPTTLCAIALGLRDYDGKRIHGQEMTAATVKGLFSKLSSMTATERGHIPCLPEKRADVVVAGSVLLLFVLEHFGLKSFFVSDRGLRHGVLLERLSKWKGP